MAFYAECFPWPYAYKSAVMVMAAGAYTACRPSRSEAFPAFRQALDHARRQCGAAPATIELMIEGRYAVVHQESGWPRQLVKPEGEPSWPTAEITDTRGGRALTRLRHWLASAQ
jgi:hypothetical protein